MFQLVQMTALYSNAVLVAILPHFTDVAQKLNISVHTPITPAQVRHFYCDPRADEVGGYVVLTNGYQFWFQKGDVNMFETTYCYFTLQNPDWIHYFRGTLRMNQKEAVAMARNAVHKLGHTEKIFDDEPQVSLAPKDEGKYMIPQYRIEWLKPGVTNPIFNVAAEVVVNGDLKRIERFAFIDKQFWRPNPEFGVKPELMPPPPPQYIGGRRMTPVSATYSNAFLRAALPQFTDFARRLGLPVNLPLQPMQFTNVNIGLLDGDTHLQIILSNGYRFNYRKGYVSDFYAPDCYFTYEWEDNGSMKNEDFNGPLDVPQNELIRLAREAVHKLGYSEKILHMESEPLLIGGPDEKATYGCTRYLYAWDVKNVGTGIPKVSVCVEVDAKIKTVKSIFLDNTNLWREPPKMDLLPKPKK
jgi:hypothetical protein